MAGIFLETCPASLPADRRPAFRNLLRKCRAKQVDLVLVLSLIHICKAGAGYTLTSFDTGLLREELDSLHDYVPSVIDVEDIAIDRILIEEIRVALRGWKPWAEELLDFYLSGGKRCCTESLCKRYNLKERTIRKRKEEFNKFILDFLKK